MNNKKSEEIIKDILNNLMEETNTDVESILKDLDKLDK